MQHIYLDYNATTPVAPSVQEAMAPFLSEHFGNPSSSHSLGRACHEAIEDARGKVAALLGADNDEIVFTAGGTESNNLALKGVMFRDATPASGHLIISAIEHPAIVSPANFLKRMGCELSVIGCNRQGVVQVDELEQALRPDTRLVSIMHANNETGVIQPVREIAELCRSRGILFHTDAAQSVGKIRTVVEELGVDMLSIAGHKLYAPKGVGALYIRRGITLEPLLHGAGHESGIRAGTENTPYIVGFGKAAALVRRGLDETSRKMKSLRDLLFARLAEGIGDELTINGEGADRLPNTLNVNFPRVSAPELLSRIPEVCASTGAACHSGGEPVSSSRAMRASTILAAMGVPQQTARGAVRLSVGWYTSEDRIERAASLLLAAWENLVQ